MSEEFDVRFTKAATIEVIRFADDHSAGDGVTCASTLTLSDDFQGRVLIIDAGGEFVLLHDAEHARHLIAALDKAVKIGWLK